MVEGSGQPRILARPLPVAQRWRVTDAAFSTCSCPFGACEGAVGGWRPTLSREVACLCTHYPLWVVAHRSAHRSRAAVARMRGILLPSGRMEAPARGVWLAGCTRLDIVVLLRMSCEVSVCRMTCTCTCTCTCVCTHPYTCSCICMRMRVCMCAWRSHAVHTGVLKSSVPVDITAYPTTPSLVRSVLCLGWQL